METIKQGTESVGLHLRARVVKNKMAPPFRVAEFDIMFGRGISREADLIDLGAQTGFLKKTGAFYSYGEVRLGQGRENAKAFLKDNAEIATALELDIRGGNETVTATPTGLSPSPLTMKPWRSPDSVLDSKPGHKGLRLPRPFSFCPPFARLPARNTAITTEEHRYDH